MTTEKGQEATINNDRTQDLVYRKQIKFIVTEVFGKFCNDV